MLTFANEDVALDVDDIVISEAVHGDLGLGVALGIHRHELAGDFLLRTPVNVTTFSFENKNVKLERKSTAFYFGQQHPVGWNAINWNIHNKQLSTFIEQKPFRPECSRKKVLGRQHNKMEASGLGCLLLNLILSKSPTVSLYLT